MIHIPQISKISVLSIWRTIFFTLVIIYALKGILYETGDISKRIALIEMLFCFVFCLLVVRMHSRPRTIEYLLYFSGLIFVSYCLSPKSVNHSITESFTSFTFFREYAGAIMPLFPVYYFARKGKISDEIIKRFFIIYFIVSIFVFFHETIEMLQIFNKENMTSNYAYSFVYLVPFLGLFRKKILTLPFWIVAISLAVMSAKRGVMIGLIIQISYFYWNIIRNSKKKFLVIALLIIVLIVATAYIIDYYNSNPFFQSRIEDTLEGKSSLRDELYSKIIDNFSSSSLFNMMFGHGFISVVSVAGNYAHNDWLEILYDFGVIGVSLYLLIFYSLWKFSRKLSGRDRQAFIMGILALFFSSLYSMSFFSAETCTVFILFGFILGKYSYDKYNRTPNPGKLFQQEF